MIEGPNEGVATLCCEACSNPMPDQTPLISDPHPSHGCMAEPARIVVVHHDLYKQGGGEFVCMTVLEALQSEYDVTLLTSRPVSNFDELNGYYNTAVTDVTVKPVQPLGIDLATITDVVDSVAIGPLERLVDTLRNAIYHRFTASELPACDLVVTTSRELALPISAIHYVNFPETAATLDRTHPIFAVVAPVVKRLAGFDKAAVRDDLVLVNSEWSGEFVEDFYDQRPRVLHPPIDIERLDASTPWEAREDGFVMLGRIAPVKNVLTVIDILTRVRDRGHDIHLHIVGPEDDDHTNYYDQVAAVAAERSFVVMEGPKWGKDLTEILSRHRYGINGATDEHFGMAVAEMVASGMVPFVPDGGGQRDIVNHHSDLIYADPDDAVEKIDRLLSTPDRAETVRTELPDIEARYGKERFQRTIRELVAEALAN